MRMFDRLYDMTEEAVNNVKKPFVEKKIVRTIDSEIDSLEMKKINLEEKENSLLKDIAKDNGDMAILIKNLIETRIERGLVNEVIRAAALVKHDLFDNEPTQVEKRVSDGEQVVKKSE